MNKALEIKTSTLFNLDFANNSILSYFFFIFSIIVFYLLIPAAIAQMFNPIGIPSKNAKVAIEIHPAIVKVKVRKCLL